MRLADCLRQQADRLLTEPQPMTVAWVLAQAGPVVPGLLLVFIALPSVLPVPGIGNVTGAALMGMAACMLVARPLQIPQRLAQCSVAPELAARCLRWMARVLEYGERIACRRGEMLLRPTLWRCSGVPVGLMGLLIFLPMPLGNPLGALAVIFVGLGYALEDGLLILGGWLLSLGASLVYGLLAWTTWVAGRAWWAAG
jgi:hypothetical protein